MQAGVCGHCDGQQPYSEVTRAKLVTNETFNMTLMMTANDRLHVASNKDGKMEHTLTTAGDYTNLHVQHH